MTKPPESQMTFRIKDRVSAIPATIWNGCAGQISGQMGGQAGNPFLSHEFLVALEESGSVGGQSGWHPMPVTAENAAGEVLGVVPLYRKDHSYGEYVFDQQWATAFAAAGGQYYPKLQIAVPFTPVAGARLLLHPNAPAQLRGLMLNFLVNFCGEQGFSGIHATFVETGSQDGAAFAAKNFLPRHDYQFHWQNENYQDFDGFLAKLNHRKRKAIKKERAAAASLGLQIVTLSGDAIKPAHWDGFYACYRATSGRKWGRAYLTRDFFAQIGETMRANIVLVLAMAGENIIAGAINFRAHDVLYGRNWGCLEELPNLHFECCYYRALDYAIAHNITRVEAGAQGLHKIQRGYLPNLTQSFHYVVHGGLAAAIADFLTAERAIIAQNIKELATDSPFKSEEANTLS